MKTMNTVRALLALTALGTLASTAQAATIQITEYMYQGAADTNREFVELTNLGSAAIDMTGWSFDDDSQTAGVFSLSGFGVVNVGESVIFTEMSAADFRAAWGLTASVDVLGGNTTGLGRADQINIFDSSGTLVDSLSFGDQAGQGPRTRGISANSPNLAGLDTSTAAGWLLSTIGDAEGSFASTFGDVANPGRSSFAPAPAPVPLPAAAWLLVSGLGMLGAMKRRVAA